MRHRGTRTHWLIALGALLVAGVTAPAVTTAQVTLENGMGGTRDFGTECLSPNDDGSSRLIDLSTAFPMGLRFFDRVHTSAYVNTNGNITFSGPLSQFTPDAFPVANQPMIAPYWADVDIRGEACEGFGGDAGCANPETNGVWWHLEPGRMTVTWDEVGYFACHDDLKMSFQMILTAVPGCGAAGDFDVEFRYAKCQWVTGDASGGTDGFGGTPAQAGFDAGNTRDFVEIRNSRTETIHTTLCSDSNVGEPGIWRFQIRSGAVLCPDVGEACDTGGVGVCAEGRNQCVGSGVECHQLLEASDERCDSLDNDCDGSTDEGDALCDVGEQCIGGSCIEPCFEGGCPEGLTCHTSTGRCVEPGCEDVACEAGQRCRAGSCVDACDGVVCPAGQSCAGGRCSDLCATLTCDDCTVCEEGACVPRCQFDGCETGERCVEDGRCVESACDGVRCDPGFVCRGGLCADACEGAVCPLGEICEAGECVPEPRETLDDAGVVDSVPDSGVTGTPDAGPTMAPDAGTGGGGDLSFGRRRSGCQVTLFTGGASRDMATFALTAFVGIFFVGRRRRSRAR